MQCDAIPWQYHQLQYDTMQYDTIQLNTMQYHAIPSNTSYHVIPYLGRLKPQLGQKGCILALCVCFWPVSPAGWFHMGCNSAGWAGRSVAMLWTPHKAIFRTKRYPTQMEPWTFRIWGQRSHFGPYRLSQGPNIFKSAHWKKKKKTACFSAKIRFHPPASSYSLGWWYKVAISM